MGDRLGDLLATLIPIHAHFNEAPDSPLKGKCEALIKDLLNFPLTNEEDPEKEQRLNQLASQVKVLSANFTAKVGKIPRKPVSLKPETERFNF